MAEFQCDACRDAQVLVSPQYAQVQALVGNADVTPARMAGTNLHRGHERGLESHLERE